jgi:hypothetical protein
MPIILEATYSKKLGFANHGSHSYVLSLRTELTDIDQMPDESNRLYRMLQDAVDREIQQAGYVPDTGLNGSAVGIADAGFSAPSPAPPRPHGGSPMSDNQLALIHRIIRENNGDKQAIEQLAIERFGAGVNQLNRMQASSLIDELFEQYGRKGNGGRWKQQRATAGE